MNKQLFKIFEDHIYFPEDWTKVCWAEDFNTISYNKEDNVGDLIDGNGETYSGEVREGPIEIDGYVMYLLDSSCGFDYQAIFSLALKVEDEQ
jgi:hypothetical protein